MKDKKHYLEGVGNHNVGRDIAQPVNLTNNPPKRVLHVYSTAPYVVDKTPEALDMGLIENDSLDQLFDTVKRKTQINGKPNYHVDDEMKLDNTTEAERQEEKKRELEDAKKELNELKRKCFNCGQKTHRKADCPQRGNHQMVAECYNRLRALQDIIDGADPRLLEDESGEKVTQSPSKKKRVRREDKQLDVARPLDTTFSPGPELS